MSDECLEKVKEIIKKNKDVVIWIQDRTIVTHRLVRTPAIGWSTLTMLEALCDSAKTALHIQAKREKPDYTTVFRSLNKALAILRKRIAKEKRNNHTLHTCEYRETKRTRCNRYPTRYNPQKQKYLCEKHY